MPVDHENVGERLKRLRLERGLSQRELATPGVSYAYISRIEAGTRQPSVKALRKLARQLDVSTEYLETGRDIDDSRRARVEHRRRRARAPPRRSGHRGGASSRSSSRRLCRPATVRTRRARASALALAAFERGEHAATVAGFEEAFAARAPVAARASRRLCDARSRVRRARRDGARDRALPPLSRRRVGARAGERSRADALPDLAQLCAQRCRRARPRRGRRSRGAPRSAAGRRSVHAHPPLLVTRATLRDGRPLVAGAAVRAPCDRAARSHRGRRPLRPGLRAGRVDHELGRRRRRAHASSSTGPSSCSRRAGSVDDIAILERRACARRRAPRQRRRGDPDRAKRARARRGPVRRRARHRALGARRGPRARAGSRRLRRRSSPKQSTCSRRTAAGGKRARRAARGVPRFARPARPTRRSTCSSARRISRCGRRRPTRASARPSAEPRAGDR